MSTDAVETEPGVFVLLVLYCSFASEESRPPGDEHVANHSRGAPHGHSVLLSSSLPLVSHVFVFNWLRIWPSYIPAPRTGQPQICLSPRP